MRVLSLHGTNDRIDRKPDNTDHDIEQCGIIINIPALGIGSGMLQRNQDKQPLDCVFHVRMRTPVGSSYEFQAVFEGNARINHQNLGGFLYVVPLRKAYLSGSRATKRDLEQFVLIGVFDVTQDRKRMHGQRWIRSGVRLYEKDSGLHVFAECLDDPFLLGIRRAIPNRKADSGIDGDSVGGFMHGNRPNQVIEGAPEVVEDIGDSQRPTNDGRLVVNCYDQTGACKIFAQFSSYGVRYFAHPSKDFHIEFMEQFFSVPESPENTSGVHRAIIAEEVESAVYKDLLHY